MGAADIRLETSFRFNRKRKKLFMSLGAEGVLAFIDLMLSTAESRPEPGNNLGGKALVEKIRLQLE